ncbi:hypothetical protein D9M73_132840 [compost metagenome]
MPSAIGEPLAEFLRSAVQQDEPGRRGDRRHQPVAIAAPQRRTGRHHQAVDTHLGIDRTPQTIEPRPAVGVVQRLATAHLGHGGGVMEGIALKERRTKRGCEQGTERGLATAADAHHDYRHRRDHAVTDCPLQNAVPKTGLGPDAPRRPRAFHKP